VRIREFPHQLKNDDSFRGHWRSLFVMRELYRRDAGAPRRAWPSFQLQIVQSSAAGGEAVIQLKYNSCRSKA
jgi:hypothetical protein